MESLTFSMLVTQFLKNEQELCREEFLFNYESRENTFQDVVFITAQRNFKTYYFALEHHRWETLRELCFFTNNSDKFYFRVNPVDESLIRINDNRIFCWMQPEIPPDLQEFGNRILQMILEIYQKIQQDRLALISACN